MAKPELGTKRVCVACGTRFYDLTKVRAVCPQCGTEQPIEQPRPRRTVIEERRPKKPSPAPSMEEAEIEVEGVEEEGEEIEDADELEDDADTIGPEIEVEPDHDRTER